MSIRSFIYDYIILPVQIELGMGWFFPVNTPSPVAKREAA